MMFKTIPIAGLIAFLLWISNANAFWRLLCDGSVGLARIDPLISPGGVSDHVHSIKGGSAFSPTVQSAGLADSNCSSCDVIEDNSAYWAPALYFMNTDDNNVEIVPEKPPHKSYYFLNTGMTSDGKTQKIEAFPGGFQMISGSNFNRNSSLPNPDPNPLGPWADESQELRAQRALGFNCLNYAKGSDEPSLFRHFMPDKSYLDANCADGVRLELMFPSCWNGELDGGKEHKSHVAFPDGVMVGNCPKGYDRRLVSLFYETIVATDQFKGKNGKFVFSNGDPTGFGYHGDFIDAWAPGVLQQAVEQCTNPSGDMRDCPLFSFHSDPESCGLEYALPAQISSENVKGPMEGLPNGLPVQPGPEPATKVGGYGSSKPSPAVSSSQPAPATTSAVKVPTVPIHEHRPVTSVLSNHPDAMGSEQYPDLKANFAQMPSPSPSSSSASSPPQLSQSSTLSKPPISSPLPSLSPSTAPSSSPTTASSPSPSTLSSVPTLAPMAKSINPDLQAITTAFWTSGHEAHEVIVMLTELYVTATAATVTTTDATTTTMNTYHKRHAHKHHHHAARGIGGRLLR